MPLIEAGFIDWMVSTGANLYHDTHHALGHSIHAGSTWANDVELREQGTIRIYDIVFDQNVLLGTDAFFRKVLGEPEFSGPFDGGDPLQGGPVPVGARGAPRRHRHRAARRRVPQRGADLRLVAGRQLDRHEPGGARARGPRPADRRQQDVNRSAAIVYDAKKSGGRTACWILGGGSPKNFMLQTEPHMQEVLGLPEAGHDYFLQFTDARPDTGGLSGATPSEAMTWGKVDPDQLPSTVVAYVDSTIALPILTHYVMANVPPRKPKRLADRLDELLAKISAGRGELGPALE